MLQGDITNYVVQLTIFFWISDNKADDVIEIKEQSTIVQGGEQVIVHTRTCNMGFIAHLWGCYNLYCTPEV